MFNLDKIKKFIHKFENKKSIKRYSFTPQKLTTINVKNIQKKPSVAIISMVKNEAEIIEAFIRINTRWSSHIYIMDDYSVDQTGEIISSLQSEGAPITYLRSGSIDYQQNKKTTDLLRSVANLGLYDFIAVLDADEFIFDGDLLLTELDKLSPNEVIYIKWRTLVPMGPVGKIGTIQNYSFLNFKQLKKEIEFEKVIVGGNVAKKCLLTMGNHDVICDKKNIIKIKIPLYHAPVRNKWQLFSKIIIGRAKFEIKENRRKGEGQHWTNIYNELHNNKFKLNNEDLTNISYSYIDFSQSFSIENLEDFPYFDFNLQLKYSVESEVLTILNLSGFIQELLNYIKNNRN
jgi:hypothetical protein